jgi:hypothetical protein
LRFTGGTPNNRSACPAVRVTLPVRGVGYDRAPERLAGVAIRRLCSRFVGTLGVFGTGGSSGVHARLNSTRLRRPHGGLLGGVLPGLGAIVKSGTSQSSKPSSKSIASIAALAKTSSECPKLTASTYPVAVGLHSGPRTESGPSHSHIGAVPLTSIASASRVGHSTAGAGPAEHRADSAAHTVGAGRELTHSFATSCAAQSG